ncbi:MAG TPA: prepilin-type N-terminal cleavage/methylation domain-containing protein [Acidimicrobiales bacterium]|nr:prepilin-type N-terminal cleavage/methylation domain-containing protein [Acidimicrobiales bacterium]
MIGRFRVKSKATKAGHDQDGFTLIEILVVIVIMGILAAVVVFSLGGVTGRSAVAACNTDVKTVEVGVQAYEANSTIDPSSAPPASIAALLTSGANGTNAALRGWPSNGAYYYIGLAISTTNLQYITSSGTQNITGLSGLVAGQVYVDAGTPPATPLSTFSNWQNYDSYTTTGGGSICSLA